MSSSYYKSTSDELFRITGRQSLNLTVSEVEEVKLESDKKVGKVEQEIQNLYDRIEKMEKDNAEMREQF